MATSNEYYDNYQEDYSDENDMTIDHRGCINTRQALHEIRVNPFSQNGRDGKNNNYPGLDHVFSPDRSIISPPSELNMSIGARAAINEHARHIAKYGLDGFGDSSSPSLTQQDNSIVGKDDEWERLMNGTSISHASFSSTFIGESSKFHTLNTTFDQSSDFFNSSRVAMLRTPEKNKAKVDEASRLARLECVGTSSGGRDINYSESLSGSANGSDNFDQSGMIGLFNAAMRFRDKVDFEDSPFQPFDVGDEEQDSLVSYQEPNLSMISGSAQGATSLLFHTNDIRLQSSDKKSPPSDFCSPDHLCQESSFISYHEPELSIISNRPDDKVKDSFLDYEGHEDSNHEMKITPIKSLSREQDVWDSPTLNEERLLKHTEHDKGFCVLSQTGTLSDFNPVFSHIEDCGEDRLNSSWIENNIEANAENEANNIVDHFRLRNATLRRDYENPLIQYQENDELISKKWSGKKSGVSSPQKSEFNVDVSEIGMGSECDSRFVKSRNIDMQLSNRSSKERSEHEKVIQPHDRESSGLLPFSGDSPIDSIHNDSVERKTLYQQRREQNRPHQEEHKKPRVSRLAERYSRPDRFEDDYIASNNSTDVSNRESTSVSRSLLGSFEFAC